MEFNGDEFEKAVSTIQTMRRAVEDRFDAIASKHNGIVYVIDDLGDTVDDPRPIDPNPLRFTLVVNLSHQKVTIKGSDKDLIDLEHVLGVMHVDNEMNQDPGAKEPSIDLDLQDANRHLEAALASVDRLSKIQGPGDRLAR